MALPANSPITLPGPLFGRLLAVAEAELPDVPLLVLGVTVLCLLVTFGLAGVLSVVVPVLVESLW